jgi:hypothetical protein
VVISRIVPELPNLDGEAGIGALTTLSPVADLGALRRRLALVANWPGIGRPLLELSFIHFARWTLLTSLPAPDGSGDDYPLNWPYLLFQASYDGKEDEYLNTFTDVIPWRLVRLFGTCFGFEELVIDAPGADGRPMAPWAFRKFVDDNKLQILDFRPDAGGTVSAVRQALMIERAERRANRLSGAALEFAQRDVESLATGPPPAKVSLREGIVDPLMRRARRSREVTTLTIVAPLESPEYNDLQTLFKVDQHPLRGFPPSHFARVALMPHMMMEVGQPFPDLLPVPYLVMSCDYDGDLDAYLDAITAKRATCHAVDALLCHCAGYPGTDRPRALRHWLKRHSRRPNYSVAGYQPRSAAEIQDVIKARERVAGRLDWGL